MEAHRWFILHADEVRGPFDAAAVETEVAKLNQPLVWGRGQTDWLSPDQWRRSLSNLDANVTRARAEADREWRLRVRGQEFQPMIYSQMIDYLRSQSDFSDILIWTEGYADWKELYQIHKILDDLGVSRRKHPRVPIMGTVEFEGSNGTFTGRALSISEGGLGVVDAPPVRIGDRFKVSLKSNNLFHALTATAEVIFSGSDGYCGMKFTGLPMESKSAIIEYVKRFIEGQVGTGTYTKL